MSDSAPHVEPIFFAAQTAPSFVPQYIPPPPTVAVSVSARIPETHRYMVPVDATFMVGDLLNGITTLSAHEVSYGARLIAPLSRRANVLSRSEASFTGELYDIYTDYVGNHPFVVRKHWSGEPAFCVRCFSGSTLLRLRLGGRKSFRYEVVPVESIEKNDVVVAVPGIVSAAMRNMHQLKTEHGEMPSMVVRVSQAIRRTVKNTPAISITTDTPAGVIMDGIAVRRYQ